MLNDENRAALLNKVSQDFGPETPSDVLSVDATQGGSVQEIKTEDVKIEVPSTDPEATETVEVETQSVEASGVDNDSNLPKGHKVPYNRFKSVLESRNNFRSEVETYKEKLTSLEEKLANLEQSRNVPTPSQETHESSTWLDDYLAEQEVANTPEWQSDYNSLNDRLYKFEVAQEEVNLKNELAELNKQYPNVPDRVLLKAVIDDPNADLRKYAEDYSLFMAGIEEQAIARYLEKNGGAPTEDTKASALQRPRSASAPRQHFQPNEKPKTIQGASAMLRDLLHKDNFLKK
jgi:uncharacterized phage infection (PIP) family protein YhgE